MRDVQQDHLVVVAMGSNLGDSEDLLRCAVEALGLCSAGGVRCSSLYRTEPLDCPPGSPDFVNAVACFEALPGDTPESLLVKLQGLERQFGRQPKRLMNEPRPLDLDLILFGLEVRQSPELTLPHPRAHLRRFVLEPLNELEPDLRLPGQSRSVRELLADLTAKA